MCLDAGSNPAGSTFLNLFSEAPAIKQGLLGLATYVFIGIDLLYFVVKMNTTYFRLLMTSPL